MTEEETMRKIPRWGFGMAPLKPATNVRYCDAIRVMKRFLSDFYDMEQLTPTVTGEVKGLINRCIRQDQWDWFTVYTRFGEPDPLSLRPIPQLLIDLREYLKKTEIELVHRARKRLLSTNLLTYCLYFLGDETPPLYNQDGGGHIYILSIREQPDILKIGMTTRSVADRVKEINSATGVLIPFSVRRVFKVRDARKAETELFHLLSLHRIRTDREFFKMSFGDAVRAVEKYLDDERLIARLRGTVVGFSIDKGYGFITVDQGEDIFLHISEIPENAWSALNPGTRVEFDIGHTPRGKCARNVSFL